MNILDSRHNYIGKISEMKVKKSVVDGKKRVTCEVPLNDIARITDIKVWEDENIINGFFCKICGAGLFAIDKIDLISSKTAKIYAGQ